MHKSMTSDTKIKCTFKENLSTFNVPALPKIHE